MRGTKTQTIHVRTVDATAGDYERVYRLPIAEDIEPVDLAELADAAALHDWVTSHRGMEGCVTAETADRSCRWLTSSRTRTGSQRRRRPSRRLDEGVTVFLTRPYLHRVEPSLHAEVYLRLKQRADLVGEFPTAHG